MGNHHRKVACHRSTGSDFGTQMMIIGLKYLQVQAMKRVIIIARHGLLPSRFFVLALIFGRRKRRSRFRLCYKSIFDTREPTDLHSSLTFYGACKNQQYQSATEDYAIKNCSHPLSKQNPSRLRFSQRDCRKSPMLLMCKNKINYISRADDDRLDPACRSGDENGDWRACRLSISPYKGMRVRF